MRYNKKIVEVLEAGMKREEDIQNDLSNLTIEEEEGESKEDSSHCKKEN